MVSKRIFQVQAPSLHSKCQNYYNHQTFIIQILHRPDLQNVYITVKIQHIDVATLVITISTSSQDFVDLQTFFAVRFSS
jgi:hypothetical protein